jgi:hypothetical protein
VHVGSWAGLRRAATAARRRRRRATRE